MFNPLLLGSFCIYRAELSSCNRDCMTCKASSICYLIFFLKNTKCLPVSDVEDHLCDTHKASVVGAQGDDVEVVEGRSVEVD